MARSTKTTAAVAEPKTTARKAAARAKPAAAAPEPVPPAPAPAAAIPARVPPPSKGELRAHIEKLEVANAALKAKSREANRAAKAANKRIAELEAEVAQLQEQTARPVASPAAEKPARRGGPPRSRGIDPGDAVPPGVAVLDPEPLDAEAQAARDALEAKLSGE